MKKIRNIIFEAARKPFRWLGLDLVKEGSARLSMERLALIQELGFVPRCILDGGAFHGYWTRDTSRIFAKASYIVVEPNPELQRTLEQNLRGIAATVVPVALSDQKGTAELNLWRKAHADTGASLLENVSGPAQSLVEVEVDTIDSISERLSLKPDLLKLDLQGAELAALRGAEKVLQTVEVAMIEFGVLDAYVGRATPRELLDIMYDHDFCLYDIVDTINRPYDGALCSGDFIFVKNASKLRAHKAFR